MYNLKTLVRDLILLLLKLVILITKRHSIIETHKPNVLLRVHRLVNSGFVSFSDVVVVLVDHAGVKNITVKENGGLSEGLPMVFFGCDLIEGLSFQ